jgi:hypothetical protein
MPAAASAARQIALARLPGRFGFLTSARNAAQSRRRCNGLRPIRQPVWQADLVGLAPAAPIFTRRRLTAGETENFVAGSSQEASDVVITRRYIRQRVPGNASLQARPPATGLYIKSLICRVSSAVEQRFCKPLVGSSILSPGTNKIRHFCNFARRNRVAACRWCSHCVSISYNGDM